MRFELSWLHASLRFSTLDKIAKRLGTLVKKAIALGKASKLNVGVLMGVVDLIEAYRQLSVDTTERWASGFSFLNEHNELEFGIDERFGFGGTLHPVCFCRMTNANVVVFDQKLTRELTMPVPLLREWRAHLEQEPFSLRDGVLHRQIYGRAATYTQRMEAGDDLEEEGVAGEEEWPFQGISRADGLTHSRPLRQAVAPVNPYRKSDTFAVVAHIDDNMLAMLAVISPEGITAAEAVREGVIKGTFREENLPVDSTERGKKKDSEGTMRQNIKFLGIIWNLTDLQNPTMAIPESRINKMQVLLAEIRTGNKTHLPTTTVQSLAGKLVNMACVVRRGRIHVCGVFCGHLVRLR